MDADFLEKHQESAETAALVGIVYSLLDDPRRAIQQFQIAQKREPSYANTFNYWGYTLMSWELPDGADPWAVAAQKKLDEATRLSSEYVWPILNLGDLALTRVAEPTEADYDSAQKYFERAEGLVPPNPNAYMDSAICLVAIGVLHKDAGDPTRATEYFGKASAKFRRASEELGLDSATLHVNWGYLFEVTGNTEQALKHYDRALELKPKFVRACLNRAELLEALGKGEEAARSYARCRDLQVELATQLGERAADAPDSGAATRLRAVEQEVRGGISHVDEKIRQLETVSPKH